MDSLARGPSERQGERGNSRRALVARLRERTAQLELAVGAGRRLHSRQRAELEALRRELEGLRERLAYAEAELARARAEPGAQGRRDLTGWIRGRLRA